jgi:hypothetical protein
VKPLELRKLAKVHRGNVVMDVDLVRAVFILGVRTTVSWRIEGTGFLYE